MKFITGMYNHWKIFYRFTNELEILDLKIVLKSNFIIKLTLLNFQFYLSFLTTSKQREIEEHNRQLEKKGVASKA